MPIFQEHELCSEFQLLADRLPTINDGVKYILSRSRSTPDKQTRVRDFAKKTFDIWEKADCVPLSLQRISALALTIYENYVSYLKKSGNSNHRKRISSSPPPEPTRRSSRSASSASTSRTTKARPATQAISSIHPSTRSRPGNTISVREKWDTEFGEKLFDVLDVCGVAEKVKDGGAFDLEFYEDQKDPQKRLLKMQVRKVNDEFVREETRRKERLARVYARAEKADVFKTLIIEKDDEADSYADDNDTDYQVDQRSVRQQSRSSREIRSGKVDTMEQEMHLQQPKIPQLHCLESKRHIYPKYLEAMSILMADGLSAPEAVKAVHTIDTVVWGQSRLLPLRLDKSYLNMSRKLKKMTPEQYLNRIEEVDEPDDGYDGMMEEDCVGSDDGRTANFEEINDTQVEGARLTDNVDIAMQTDEGQDHIDISGEPDEGQIDIAGQPDETAEGTGEGQIDITVQTEDGQIDVSGSPVADGQEGIKSKAIIKHLEREIQKLKDVYETNRMNVLPDCRTIRRNHHLMAVYVERRLGEELVQHGGFCIPDGTTRNKVGEISAMIVKINGKMRAVKAQRIGKGDRSTWADVVVHMLQRLTVASNQELVVVWEAVKTMLSDLSRVNRTLAAEISRLIGSAWVPGQLFCVLHYVLAIPEAIKGVFMRYQTEIGSEKLFLETTGFEMNVNDKTIVIQIHDIWMGVTSIRWHGRNWNRYDS